MEEYAVVLANDLVVKASNFGGITNLKFNRQGKVVSFLYENQTYIALFEFKSNGFLDFVEEKYFEKLKGRELYKEGNKYDGVDKKLWENFVFKKYDNLTVAQFNDTIFGLLRDSSGLCYNWFTWNYTNPYQGVINPQPASNAYPVGKFCDTFENGTHAKDFFDAYKDQKFYDTNEDDIRLVGEIASLLKTAGEKTAEAFQNFNLSGVDTTVFNFRTSQNGYSREDFLQYKKGLELWLKMLKKYQSEISKLGYEEQLFIAIDVMYRHNMLTMLTVNQRINILKILVEKKLLMNWYWENFSIGFVHKEDLAIYILESFTNAADANLFLEKLASTSVIKSEYKDNQGTTYKTSYTTLYKLLFYRMDDYGGGDNFTKFVEQLQRIVLLKNNIVKADIPPSYSKTQLTAITKAQFIWREKQPEKEPKKERYKYNVISNTDKKIKIQETIIIKTELFEVYDSDVSTGASILVGYKEVPTQVEKQIFELNHFDLVSIHFYENPSFVDLTSNVTYVERHFFTFAGFIDYILEKEKTKIAEDVFNAALFVISLSIGFGEFVAAARTLNAARALVAGVMVTSDTGIFLSTNTEFHNYLVATYGVEKANEILLYLTILSTIFSLGSNSIAGSGILKKYSREEALKFVGTGQAILKDTEALKKLSTTEIAALGEAIKKIKNQLYVLRKEDEAVKIIVRTQSNIRLVKYTSLKNELEIISEVSKNRFYDDFFNVDEAFIKRLSDNPKYIEKWNNYTETEKIAAKLNKWVSLENEIVSIRHEKLYQRINLKPLLESDYVLETYGPHPLNLVNLMEAEVNELLPTFTSRNHAREHQLLSGMVDDEGIMSQFFTNYTKDQLEPGGDFDKYINNFGTNFNPDEPYMNPNFRQRFLQTSSKREVGLYNLDQPGDIVYTGDHMAMHAECRALNDLSVKKFGNVLVEPRVYDDWLKTVKGYNRNFLGNEHGFIMHTCADCYYLTDLITFIK